ncbi:MAG TPA: tetratricopeptide repeat protein [Planctomycetaceae bacterium]|nr:tetratricopeptide repeat protein [Planctomycetaceae bacterium]
MPNCRTTALRSARQFAGAVCVVVWLVAPHFVIAQDQSANFADRELRLRARVTERPDEGSSWRLLGRYLLQQKRHSEALEVLQQAVTLSPMSAAAHFDLGKTWQALGDSEAAADSFRTVIELAADSEYAQSAQENLATLRSVAAPQEVVVPVDYRIRRFDGSELADRIKPLELPEAPWWKRRLSLNLETGVLYNSNVALAPLSRELTSKLSRSAQLFVEPDVMFAVFDEPSWRSGPTLRGHFTVNEGNLRQFNLQSYRPGWFVEYFHFRGDQIFVPRLAYEFTHDEFNGSTLGNRHALLSSVNAYWNGEQSSMLFWSIDTSNFLNDGILSSVTSQDGVTNAVGVTHDVALPFAHWRLMRGGVEVSHASTKGSDFTFNGVNVFAAAAFPLAAGLELSVTGSVGYRQYPNFEFTPSRNEIIWRGGAELRKYFTDHISGALVFNFDKFDSQNPLFASQRYVSGIVVDFTF